MKTRKQKKSSIRLPINFKDRIVQAELKLEADTNDQRSIQELLSLYTLGKEYYGSINNTILFSFYKERYLQLIKRCKYNLHESNIYNFYETRHSTEPNKSIIKINVQEKVFYVSRNQLQRTFFSDMNKTVNYLSNNLNTSIQNIPTKSYLLTEKKKKNNRRTNRTFVDYKINNKKMSLFNLLNTNRNNEDNETVEKNEKVEKITPRDLNTSTQPETTFRRNYNDTMMLKSNRSCEDIFKKKNKLQKKEVILNKVKEEIDRMEYDSLKIIEIVDNEIEKQKKVFNEKKEQLEHHNDKKEKKYLIRKGTLFDKVIKTMLESKSPNNVVKKIFEFAENKIIDEQNLMHKEIEEFMMNNINEMENEIRLLRESYEDDINKFDDGNLSIIAEIVYKDIIRQLKEELESEVKKINIKYERLRVEEIEKIKSKYLI